MKELSGWIDDKGKFHEVYDWQHDAYCESVGLTSARAEMMGWIRCSYGFFESRMQISDSFERAGGRYTQKQFDTAYDWVSENCLLRLSGFLELKEHMER